MPKSIGTSGFASDGAWHIEPDSNNNAKIDWDRDRIAPAVVIHDWPFMSGSTPDEHLIEKFLFNDNAASSVIVAPTGNNANWETSEEVNRNTDNDTVTTNIRRDRGLDTKDTYHADLTTTVYTNAVFKKGSLLLSFTPQFGYDDAADQTLFNLYVDADDYIQLVYDAGNDKYELRVSWGGTLTTIADAAYTENNSLQQPTILMAGWDSEKDFLFLAKEGQVIVTGTNVGTPSASAGAYIHIGANSDGDGTTSLNADVYLDEYWVYNTCILPYGAYFTGYDQNGDYDGAHSDIDVFLEGDESNGNSLKIGIGIITILNATKTIGVDGAANSAFVIDASGEEVSIPWSGNINPYDFSISFWYKYTSGALGYSRLFSSEEGSDKFNLMRYNSDTDLRMYISGIAFTWTIPSIYGGDWHYINLKCKKDTNYFCTLILDGVDKGEIEHSATDPTLDSGDLWIGNRASDGARPCCGAIDKFYITSDLNTPQIWTNFGKPLWMPLMKDES